jgi:uncharacterized protein
VNASLRACIAVAALALCTMTCAGAQVAVPALSAHVTDLTATLPSAQRDALESKLVALEQRKGAQLAVLILPSTQPETIEQFAIRVFDVWKLGRKGVDDGALLIVAKNDRKVRIEVGRGLEGVIPDVIAHRVIDEYLTPHFRDGDFFGGLDAATDALGKLVDGEALPAPYRAPSSGTDGKAALIVWFWLTLFLCGFLSWIPGLVRVPLVGAATGFAMFVIGVAAPMFVVAGIASAIVSLWFRSAGKYVGSGGSGGWSSGGWSGGSSSSSSGGGWSGGSSSSSSGGWSGGGGSSAGGGASGSW